MQIQMVSSDLVTPFKQSQHQQNLLEREQREKQFVEELQNDMVPHTASRVDLMVVDDHSYLWSVH